MYLKIFIKTNISLYNNLWWKIIIYSFSYSHWLLLRNNYKSQKVTSVDVISRLAAAQNSEETPFNYLLLFLLQKPRHIFCHCSPELRRRCWSSAMTSVAVAVNGAVGGEGGKGSRLAVRWALENLVPKADRVVLVHVMPKITSIPTPCAFSFVPLFSLLFLVDRVSVWKSITWCISSTAICSKTPKFYCLCFVDNQTF